MVKKNPKVDAYIAKSADFAKPILVHFRAQIHKHCPMAVEVIKWGFPHFDYANGPMAHMAAFKAHCAIGFWKTPLMKSGKELFEMAKTEEAMGHFGKIKSLADLPSEAAFKKYIQEAMRLNEAGVKLAPKKESSDRTLEIPDYFKKALSKDKKALNTFNNFSYTNKKEYLTWVTEAKTETTREKRLAEAILWMREGKSRNWKYASKK